MPTPQQPRRRPGDQGKPDEAVAEYRTALRLKPDYAEAHSNLGNALRDQGKLRRRSPSAARPSASSPILADAHNNLGNALSVQGKPDDAIAEYREALRLEAGLSRSPHQPW